MRRRSCFPRPRVCSGWFGPDGQNTVGVGREGGQINVLGVSSSLQKHPSHYHPSLNTLIETPRVRKGHIC